jgi:hypothetical protein
MTVFSDTLAFDFTHTVLTLAFVPVVMGIIAAAVAMVRDPKSSSTIALGSGRHGPRPRWENRHGLRHRRPTWMSDQHGSDRRHPTGPLSVRNS